LFPSLEAYHDAENGKAFYETDTFTPSPDYSYGTSGTPTVFALREALAELDGVKYALTYPSGLSAITITLNALLQSGDHILVTDSVYGPTRRFCNKELKRFGVEVTFYDPLIGGDIATLIQPNTKVIFTESPGSLTFEVQDIPAITAVAKQHDIISIMDNSWATPLFFNPFAHGIDIAIQAATKYINGHSDVLLGVVTCDDEYIFGKLSSTYRHYGVCPSPDDCALASRGLRTIAVRVKQHQSNALALASWLKKQPLVNRILHPAFVDCPGHDIWKRDFTGSTGLFSIVLNQRYTDAQISAMVNGLELFGIGASWGGYESLLIHITPAYVRSATRWPEPNTVLRIYVGLEDVDDLIDDLQKGFERIVLNP
jgi:cystathionine beta-lyase